MRSSPKSFSNNNTRSPCTPRGIEYYKPKMSSAPKTLAARSFLGDIRSSLENFRRYRAEYGLLASVEWGSPALEDVVHQVRKYVDLIGDVAMVAQVDAWAGNEWDPDERYSCVRLAGKIVGEPIR